MTIQLLVNGHSLSVRQMSANFLLVDQPMNHPPTLARVVMTVDNSESDWEVNLPTGISANNPQVAIEAAAEPVRH